MISVSLTTVKLVTAVPPTVTSVAPVKPEPVIVIGVLTETGPYSGDILVTTGTVVPAAVVVVAPVLTVMVVVWVLVLLGRVPPSPMESVTE